MGGVAVARSAIALRPGGQCAAAVFGAVLCGSGGSGTAGGGAEIGLPLMRVAGVRWQVAGGGCQVSGIRCREGGPTYASEY